MNNILKRGIFFYVPCFCILRFLILFNHFCKAVSYIITKNIRVLYIYAKSYNFYLTCIYVFAIISNSVTAKIC